MVPTPALPLALPARGTPCLRGRPRDLLLFRAAAGRDEPLALSSPFSQKFLVASSSYLLDYQRTLRDRLGSQSPVIKEQLLPDFDVACCIHSEPSDCVAQQQARVAVDVVFVTRVIHKPRLVAGECAVDLLL